MTVTRENADSVLRRKVARAAARRPAMFPSRALELALAGAAQDELGMLLNVKRVEEEIETPEEVTRTIGEHALLALLDGPGGTTGLAEISAPFLAAILAQRMTGRQPATPSAPRPPTRIDAEMARGLIDRMLTEFAAALDGTAASSWAGGFRYRGHIPDIRLLRFALPDIPMRRFRLELDVIDGVADCTLRLLLPARPVVERAAGTDAPWQAAMAESVLGADLPVRAVLTRLRLPLTRVMALRSDDMLPIPAAALERVRLEGADGALVARGRLGRSGGNRAVKLVAAPQPAERTPPQDPALAAGSALSAPDPAPPAIDPQQETGAPDQNDPPAPEADPSDIAPQISIAAAT